MIISSNISQNNKMDNNVVNLYGFIPNGSINKIYLYKTIWYKIISFLHESEWVNLKRTCKNLYKLIKNICVDCDNYQQICLDNCNTKSNSLFKNLCFRLASENRIESIIKMGIKFDMICGLCGACFSRNIDLIKKILKNNITIKESHIKYIVDFATKSNEIKIIKFIIRKLNRKKNPDLYIYTILQACEINSTKIVKWTLKYLIFCNKISILEISYVYKNCLLNSIANNSVKTYKYLINSTYRNKIQLNINYNVQMFDVIKHGNIDIFNLLINKVQLSEKMIIDAAKYGHIELVKLIRQKSNYDINIYKTCLIEAVSNNHIHIVKYLIDEIYELKNINKNKFLKYAIILDNFDIANFFIELETNINICFVMLAISYYKPDHIIEKLISKTYLNNLNINKICEHAAAIGNIFVLNDMIIKGADPEKAFNIGLDKSQIEVIDYTIKLINNKDTITTSLLFAIEMSKMNSAYQIIKYIQTTYENDIDKNMINTGLEMMMCCKSITDTDKKIISLFIKLGATIHKYIADFAIKANDICLINSIITNCITDHNIGLLMACEINNLELIKYTIQQGATDYTNALTILCKNENIDYLILKYLLNINKISESQIIFELSKQNLKLKIEIVNYWDI